MISTIFSKLTEKFVEEVYTKTSDLLSDLSDEAYHFFFSFVKRYLARKEKEVAYVKTLLNMSSPVYFYDLYYPLKIQTDEDFNSNLNRTRRTIKTVKDLFFESNFHTVIGDAGSGKSMFTRHIFLSSIKESFKIPLLLELRNIEVIDEKFDVYSYLIEVLSNEKLAPNDKIIERLLGDGKFVIIFDGYDEISGSNKLLITVQITDFVNRYPDNSYLLTSRRYANAESMQRFTNNYISPINTGSKGVEGFIKSRKINEKVKEKIVKSIKKLADESYIHSFFENPLLTSLYIKTYSAYPTIPKSKSAFYKRVITVLLREHDEMSKPGYERKSKSKLSLEAIENVIRIFSFVTYFNGEFVFQDDRVKEIVRLIISKSIVEPFRYDYFIKDMNSSYSLWVKNSDKYSFSHRSIQEYLAAYHIDRLNVGIDKIMKKLISKIEHEHLETNTFLELFESISPYKYLNFFKLQWLRLANEVVKSNKTYFLSIFYSTVIIHSKAKTFNSIHEFEYKSVLEFKRYNEFYIENIFEKVYIETLGIVQFFSQKYARNKQLQSVIDNLKTIDEYSLMETKTINSSESFDLIVESTNAERLLESCNEKIQAILEIEMNSVKNEVAKLKKQEIDFEEFI